MPAEVAEPDDMPKPAEPSKGTEDERKQRGEQPEGDNEAEEVRSTREADKAEAAVVTESEAVEACMISTIREKPVKKRKLNSVKILWRVNWGVVKKL